MELRTLPIEQLLEAPYNPRTVLKPTDPAYRKLKTSLAEFGLVEPLIWNEETAHVVGGHARLRILKELQWAEVSVSVVRLTPEREKALNVVLNNHEAQGRYDTAKLADLLEELTELPELELTGFDNRTLANLRYEPVPEPVLEAKSDILEVTLIVPRMVYLKIEPMLDELIRGHGLESHVRAL